MLRTSITQLLSQIATLARPLTPALLAGYFGLPERHFHSNGPDGPIQFSQAGLTDPVAYDLRGTLFWPADGQVVRGYPRILPASDYATDAAAVYNESALFEALALQEAAIEIKHSGIGLRLYYRKGKLHFATDAVYNGRNPLIGSGIEGVRALGIDCASQAMRLLESSYRNAAALVRLGYVAAFEMALPEIETLIPAEKPDLILIDVFDPDYCLADRLEKERIAEDYGLRVVELHGRMQNSATPAEMYSRLRALEHIAAKDDVLGFVVKAPYRSDQIALKVESPTTRQAWITVAPGDMSAAYEAAREAFPEAILPSADRNHDSFLEEIMLEYLGDRRRSVRWQVSSFLDGTAEKRTGD